MLARSRRPFMPEPWKTPAPLTEAEREQIRLESAIAVADRSASRRAGKTPSGRPATRATRVAFSIARLLQETNTPHKPAGMSRSAWSTVCKILCLRDEGWRGVATDQTLAAIESLTTKETSCP